MSTRSGPTSNRWWTQLFPALLFGVSLALRLANPLSRPAHWVERAPVFWQALLAQRFGDTVFTGHPGVTVLWLASLGQFVLRRLQPEGTTVYAKVVASGVPIAIAISLTILAVYLTLRRLLDPVMAGAAALLIAFDPQQIAASTTVHPDPLLGVLIPLGVLTLVVAAMEEKRRWVLLSGAAAGLALLTKLPALILVPMAVLSFGMAAVGMVWRRPAREFVVRSSFWLLSAAVVFVALWPAMWVRPLAALDIIYRVGFARHVLAEGPIREIVFMGQVWQGAADPGGRYYVYATLIKMSAVTFAFGLVGLALLAALARRAERGRAFWTGAAAVACAAGFLAGITLTGDKVYRYALPLLPLLDVVAGIGLVWWARGVARWLGPRWARPAGLVLVGGLVACHLALGLARWPYLSNTGNDLLGGTPAADYVLGLGLNGEGFKEAVHYIDQQPNAGRLRVGCNMVWMCRQYARFSLTTVDAVLADPAQPAPDYLIYGRKTVLQGDSVLPRGPEPLKVIQFLGVPLVWIYSGDAARRDDPALPATDYRVTSSEDFRLTPAAGAALLVVAASTALALRRPEWARDVMSAQVQ